MRSVGFPEGFRLATLERTHPRKAFDCGEATVNAWLRSRALQSQDKRLSATKVLLDGHESIAGYYTLATGQIDFGDLPDAVFRHLPRRALPVAVLAWLGVDRRVQGQGLGDLLFAQALLDCHVAGQTFAFIAVVLDCLNESAKAFYQRWDLEELPGYPYRLYLSAQMLDALANS